MIPITSFYRSIAIIHTSSNKAYGKVVGTPRLIPTSTNKAYGKLRARGGTHSPTPTNVARGEGEEGYELVDICRRVSPPPQGSELEGMYEVPLATGSPSHPLPPNHCPNAGDEEDTVYEVIP